MGLQRIMLGVLGTEQEHRAGMRVERTFLWASFAWPFAVARLLGRCLEINSAVRPGQVEKFPALMAEMNVLGTGQKAARW